MDPTDMRSGFEPFSRQGGNEKRGRRRPLFVIIRVSIVLFNYSYIHCLLAFGAGAHLELDILTFVQRLEAVRYDTREVNEDFLAVLAGNESVAFFAIEPFYLTFHKNRELVIVFHKVTQKTLAFKTFWPFFSTSRKNNYICLPANVPARDL